MHATGEHGLTRLRITDPDRDRSAIAHAGRVLREGGLVGLPTETVYGLAANACDDSAVRRIFTAKGRPADNPLIVHLASAAQLADVVAEVTPLAAALAARFWPGPLTVVLDAAADLPAASTGGLPTVAVRVPDHAVARAVIAAAGVPVAAPSANRSGRPSPTTADHVAADLGDHLDLLIDGGATGLGLESTVVDARGARPVIYREGALTREQLGPIDSVGRGVAASPGTRYRHYAPSCVVEIVAPEDLETRARSLVTQGVRAGTVASGPLDVTGAIRIADFRDVEDLAHRLYGALRDAEDAHVEVLLCAAVPEIGMGRAVMDRLRRAAASGADTRARG